MWQTQWQNRWQIGSSLYSLTMRLNAAASPFSIAAASRCTAFSSDVTRTNAWASVRGFGGRVMTGGGPQSLRQSSTECLIRNHSHTSSQCRMSPRRCRISW